MPSHHQPMYIFYFRHNSYDCFEFSTEFPPCFSFFALFWLVAANVVVTERKKRENRKTKYEGWEDEEAAKLLKKITTTTYKHTDIKSVTIKTERAQNKKAGKKGQRKT